MNDWYIGSYGAVSAAESDLHEFDVVIIVTDWTEYTEFIRRSIKSWLVTRHQRFLFVVHEPDKEIVHGAWAKEFRSIIFEHAMVGEQPSRLQLMTIAPGVSSYIKSLIETWSSGLGRNRQADVPFIAPLFPLPSSPNRIDMANICIQGSIDFARRNYTEAFEVLSNDLILSQLHVRNESVLLLGGGADAGKLEQMRPAKLQGHLQLLSITMPYKEFYDVLTRCRALLTAFATDEYIISKASSTIAAALQVECPILGDARFLKAYSFLNGKATIVFDPPANATWPDNAEEGAKAAIGQLAQYNMSFNSTLIATSRRTSAEVVYKPQNKTYVDALLRAFNAKHVVAAHDAAQGLKRSLMQHNLEVARRFLHDTARLRNMNCTSEEHKQQSKC